MNHKEQTSITALISGLLVFGVYFFWVWRAAGAGLFETETAGTFAGRSILIMIAAGIVVNIVFTILMTVFNAIITKDPNPDHLVDERDRILELRAIRVAYTVIGLLFVGCMVALALGLNPILVIQGLVFSFAFGSMLEGLLLIIFYRWGAA